MSQQSCVSTPIPLPPTTLPSCAVPIGGSNSSILDACCNGHINVLATYAPPLNTSTSTSSSTNTAVLSDNGCFQFCTTDAVVNVQSCLAAKLGAYRQDGQGPAFECFNLGLAEGAGKGSGEGEGNEGEYGSAGVVARGRVGWGMSLVVGLGVYDCVGLEAL
ncbi:hypothetical protein IQ07DRAFT_632119 [Pyrenochaeta sp. DS3sAY3a]|nr:hypothetical protein IQ07DRAFT_632119 [Pyrenochaeta sp. DS3sAY3a]